MSEGNREQNEGQLRPSQISEKDVDEASSPEPSTSKLDRARDKSITRQIDWRLIPLLMFIYTLTFLDRVNIGNARLWSLEEDLNMKGYDYNIAVLGESVIDETSWLAGRPCSNMAIMVSFLHTVHPP
jgi:hypothetical protein